MLEIWDLWIGAVGATGSSFGRSRIDASAASDCVLVHAAPRLLDVTVRAVEGGHVVAEGKDLERGEPGPMSFLIREGSTIRLEDGWPTDADLGKVVLLAGGEAGVLTAWWHAADRRSWRWSLELSNQI